MLLRNNDVCLRGLYGGSEACSSRDIDRLERGKRRGDVDGSRGGWGKGVEWRAGGSGSENGEGKESDAADGDGANDDEAEDEEEEGRCIIV